MAVENIGIEFVEVIQSTMMQLGLKDGLGSIGEALSESDLGTYGLDKAEKILGKLRRRRLPSFKQGALNHDLQDILVKAFQQAPEHNDFKRLKEKVAVELHIPIDNFLTACKGFAAEAKTDIKKNPDRAYIGKGFEHALQRYSVEESQADEKAQDKLSHLIQAAYQPAYEQAKEKMGTEQANRLLDKLILLIYKIFIELIKSDTPRANRAWRAYQIACYQAIQLQLDNIETVGAETLQYLKTLKNNYIQGLDELALKSALEQYILSIEATLTQIELRLKDVIQDEGTKGRVHTSKVVGESEKRNNVLFKELLKEVKELKSELKDTNVQYQRVLKEVLQQKEQQEQTYLELIRQLMQPAIQRALPGQFNLDQWWDRRYAKKDAQLQIVLLQQTLLELVEKKPDDKPVQSLAQANEQLCQDFFWVHDNQEALREAESKRATAIPKESSSLRAARAAESVAKAQGLERSFDPERLDLAKELLRIDPELDPMEEAWLCKMNGQLEDAIAFAEVAVLKAQEDYEDAQEEHQAGECSDEIPTAAAKTKRKKLIEAYRFMGQVFEVFPHYQLALKAYQKWAALEDKQLNPLAWAEAQHAFIRVLYELASYKKAEPLAREAIQICELYAGKNSPLLADSLNILALLLQATNRFDEAEPLMRRALAISEASYGTDHPNVATSLNNLAALLQVTNRLEEAEPLMRLTLAIDETSYGPDHLNVARDLHNLAVLLQATNRQEEAEPLIQRALAISEAGYGTDHPKVALRLNNLSKLLTETNRLKEAEPLMRRALAIHEASYGPDHPYVATSLHNLARLLQNTNRMEEAEPLMQRMLTIFLRFTLKTGHQHPHLQATFGNYGGLLMAIGQTQEQALAAINALVAEVNEELVAEGIEPKVPSTEAPEE